LLALHSGPLPEDLLSCPDQLLVLADFSFQ